METALDKTLAFLIPALELIKPEFTAMNRRGLIC
jgi:superfamily II DNA/RNA helicase